MKTLKIVGIVGFAAMMTGCVPDWARQNNTGLIMAVSRVVGSQGGAGGTPGDILLSDVNPDFNDDAIVTVSVFRKNPLVSITSPLESVRLESYTVRYFRTDGHSVEGVDVPHRITGVLNSVLILPPGGDQTITADAVVSIVRQQAKHEAPLVNLVGVRTVSTGALIIPGQGLITTIAEITVFARQVTTGEALSATGTLQVTFADFADAQ